MLRLIFMTFVSLPASSQVPGSIPWTPVVLDGSPTVPVVVPSKFAGEGFNPNIHRLALPVGWTATVFYAGNILNKPRFMAFGPNGILYVANMNGGTILALPDRNNDGVADTAYVAASGFTIAHDVRFHHDTMYVGAHDAIYRLLDTDGDGVFEQRSVLVDKEQQPGQSGGNHRTRTIVIDTVRHRLLVSVGSRGNADREPLRAHVEAYDLDGSNRRIVATGIRNAVGLEQHPRTGAIWATNNGSDMQGNDRPGEWCDVIRDGGFYGYPFAHPHQVLFDLSTPDYRDILPITANDSVLLRSMVPPAAVLQAHSAPMAIVFGDERMPERYRHGAFVALRGSWNRSPASGAKIVFLDFDDDQDTVANVAMDFCTGWMTDSNQATRWARPVGLAIADDGSLYVSLDEGKQAILRLVSPSPTSAPTDVQSRFPSIQVHPQPATDVATIRWASIAVGSGYSLVASDGSVLFMGHASTDGRLTIDCSALSSGTYTAVMHTTGGIGRIPIVVVR